jgi:hypothetical protein
MRRSLIALALTLVAAAALASTALAKESGVELSSTPFATKPGDPWSGMLTVIGDSELLAQANPSITVTNLDDGTQQTFGVQPAKSPTTGETRNWVFEVVFPAPGRYSYSVSDGVTDRDYTYPPVQIVGSGSVVPVPSSPSNGSFPVWAPIAGGIALLLAAVGGGFYVRRRRFGLSH